MHGLGTTARPDAEEGLVGDRLVRRAWLCRQPASLVVSQGEGGLGSSSFPEPRPVLTKVLGPAPRCDKGSVFGGKLMDIKQGAASFPGLSIRGWQSRPGSLRSLRKGGWFVWQRI